VAPGASLKREQKIKAVRASFRRYLREMGAPRRLVKHLLCRGAPDKFYSLFHRLKEGANFMDELRDWIRAAEAARATCVNALEFDLLIQHQKQRLEELVSVLELVESLESFVFQRRQSGSLGRVAADVHTEKPAEIRS
jgi:hypothetical protein